MRTTLVAAALAALALGSTLAPSASFAAEPEDRVISSDPFQAEMDAATAQARSTLPRFWAAFDRKGPDGFTLKVAFRTDDGGWEHIWVGDLTRKGGVIRGKLYNTPDNIKAMRLGQDIEIDPAQISDWGYVVNDKLYGNYTTRVLVRHMPPEEAAPYAATLQPSPIEP
jgi:uncharacterized protein YegJ (DUF2314 family)